MSKRQIPLVPPAGRSNKGPADAGRATAPSDAGDTRAADEGDTGGRQKNIAVNTTNQGHQQDR
jgi:hypothetical protein